MITKERGILIVKEQKENTNGNTISKLLFSHLTYLIFFIMLFLFTKEKKTKKRDGR